MASLTSVKSGNWSDPTVWSLGYVPQNSDTVTIANGHTVVFDVNQSSFTNGITLTINSGGKLTAPSSGGPYYLKSSANITLNGTLEFGTVNNPVPKNVQITIDLTSGKNITCNADSVLSIVCPDPQNRYAFLAQDANSEASTLYIDRDLRNDPDWTAGSILYMFGKGTTPKEQRLTLVSVGENYITVSPALSTSQSSGSVIAHISRNVRLIQSVSNSTMIYVANSSASVTLSFMCDGLSGNVYMINGTETALVSVVGGAYITNYGTIVSTSVEASNAIMRGNIAGAIAIRFAKFDRCVFGRATIALICSRMPNVYITNCITAASERGIFMHGSGVARNCIFRGAYGVAGAHRVVLDNCLFDVTTTEVESLTGPHQYIASYNHNQVPGAFKSWSKGGITVSSTPPAGAIGSGWYKLMLTSANDYGFWQMPVTVPAGCMLHHTIKLVASKSMSYRARVQIIDPFADPLVISNAQPLAEAVLPEGYTAGSVYMFRLTWMNTDAFPKTVLLRVVGRNADGDIYFQSHRRPDEVMVPVLADCT